MTLFVICPLSLEREGWHIQRLLLGLPQCNYIHPSGQLPGRSILAVYVYHVVSADLVGPYWARSRPSFHCYPVSIVPHYITEATPTVPAASRYQFPCSRLLQCVSEGLQPLRDRLAHLGLQILTQVFTQVLLQSVDSSLNTGSNLQTEKGVVTFVLSNC